MKEQRETSLLIVSLHIQMICSVSTDGVSVSVSVTARHRQRIKTGTGNLSVVLGRFKTFLCTVHFVNVKRPTNASIVIQYNSIFFHSYVFRHLKCHLQGVY
jgi:hypothetical protein